MLRLLSGVVAATVTLPAGSDKAIQSWWGKARKKEGVILFGASDLLLVTSDVFQFDGSAEEPVGRTANTYLAATLADVHTIGRPGLFRALSFFRAQRPEYEQLTVERLEKLLEKFKPICQQHKVSCRVLLGYGWADLYLDLSSDSFNPLFAAIVACRAVMLDDPPAPGVFHNAFTIVGVDSSRESDAEVSEEKVMPKISLRVEPSELSDIINRQLRFDRDVWNVTVTSGKRDIFIIPKHSAVSFGEFWVAHRNVRRKIGEAGFPVHKMETHFDFDPNEVLPAYQETTALRRCTCSVDGRALEERFDSEARDCSMMGPGLKNSFHGLARLYLEALDGGDSCCDFDAAAAHFFSQRAVFREYQELCEKSKTLMEADSAEAQRTRRRRGLIRDVIERLEVSSVFIFNQEQNGSYSDLLSRSERVSLYRGGMQKINVALLIAIDNLVARQELSIWPMLCWWPAGQIQSERPTGVIKVPVFFLHRPEVAFFLIIHELGQLTAYDYYHKQPLPSEDDVRQPITLADRRVAKREMGGIKLGTTLLMEGVVEYAEGLGGDTGKFITDLWADVYLLRMGFKNDFRWWRNFLFEQFLELIKFEHGLVPLHVRCVQFVARLICLTAAALSLAEKRDGATRCAITEVDLRNARKETLQYLSAAGTEHFRGLIKREDDVDLVLNDSNVIQKAAELASEYSDWVEEALQQVDTIEPDAEASAEDIQRVKDGYLTEIDSAQVTSYFRALLNVEENAEDASDDEKRALFLARAALISSILGSCKRAPRLPKDRSRL